MKMMTDPNPGGQKLPDPDPEDWSNVLRCFRCNSLRTVTEVKVCLVDYFVY